MANTCPVRSQGLFTRLLPLSTGPRNVIRALPLSNIMYGYMSEYTSCGALGIILGIYLLIVVTSVINRVSYFAILPCPYEAGQESQAQAATYRNSKCVKQTVNVSYVNVRGQMLYLC